MHSRLVCKNSNTQKNVKTLISWKRQNPEINTGIVILVICSLNRCTQSTRKQVFRYGTDRQPTDIVTLRLNPPSGPMQWKQVLARLRKTCRSRVRTSWGPGGGQPVLLGGGQPVLPGWGQAVWLRTLYSWLGARARQRKSIRVWRIGQLWWPEGADIGLGWVLGIMEFCLVNMFGLWKETFNSGTVRFVSCGRLDKGWIVGHPLGSREPHPAKMENYGIVVSEWQWLTGGWQGTDVLPVRSQQFPLWGKPASYPPARRRAARMCPSLYTVHCSLYTKLVQKNYFCD